MAGELESMGWMDGEVKTAGKDKKTDTQQLWTTYPFVP